MRFTSVPDYGDDIGSMGAVVGFDTPEEVSLFEQLVRVHEKVLSQRLVGLDYRNAADKTRLEHQLAQLRQWITELSKEEGEYVGDEEPQ